MSYFLFLIVCLLDNYKMYKLMREIYYFCFNTILHFNHSGYLYCFCHKYQGCDLSNNRGCNICLTCQFNYENSEDSIEEIKYNKTKLMVFYFKLLNTFNEIIKSDGQEKISQLWTGDFQFSYQHWWNGTKTYFYLKDILKY